jgi:GT2 family glycosyltransferase
MVAGDQIPFVSIVIVNHNGKHFLKECLGSLENVSYPKDRFEVILVDNASTDGSAEYVATSFPRVRMLPLDRNYGFCKPNNEGVKISRGEYVALLNNDTMVGREWLSELVKAAMTDDRVACCAGKILYYDRRDTINAAGGKLNIIGGGSYRGYGDKDGAKYAEAGPTGFGCAAGLLVRKTFFESIGGFDEDYFASCEENDLGWKSWLYGYRVLYVPTAVMYHKESGTFGSRSTFEPTKVYLITRNRLYNVIKNLEAMNMMRSLFISLAFNAYRAARYTVTGNFASVLSIIRAHIDFLRKIRVMYSRRRVVQKNRRLSDKELYRLGVIATFGESLSEERRLSRVLGDKFYKV